VSKHPPVAGYELLELRRRNGYLVYLARQSRSGLIVDLSLVNTSGTAALKAAETLREQAETLATLDHPNILGVIDVGDARGTGFFTALEHPTGGCLADKVRRGPLVWTESAIIARAIASALQYARACDAVHVNLHPGTVLLKADNMPALADFRRVKAGNSHGFIYKTLTLSYTAPEELADFDEESTPRTDVYRIGAALYAMLTGQPPFAWIEDSSTMFRQLLERSPSPVRQHNPTVPPDLDAICMRCLEKQQTARYAEPEDLVDALSRILAGAPRTQ